MSPGNPPPSSCSFLISLSFPVLVLAALTWNGGREGLTVVVFIENIKLGIHNKHLPRKGSLVWKNMSVVLVFLSLEDCCPIRIGLLFSQLDCICVQPLNVNQPQRRKTFSFSHLQWTGQIL